MTKKKKPTSKKVVKKKPIKKSKVIKPKRMDLTENLDPFTKKEKELLENNIILKEKKVKEDAKKRAEKRLNKIKAEKETFKKEVSEMKKNEAKFIEIKRENSKTQTVVISDSLITETSDPKNADLLKIGICFTTDQAIKLCKNFGFHDYYIRTEIVNHFKYTKKFHVYKILNSNDGK
jgi:hypothetical protein